MRIAVIGAGFTGLTAAFKLSKKGHEVFVFEKDQNPGGLTAGFKENGWEWFLEEHYHHFFTNDKYLFKLAKEIKHEILIKRPKTSTYINGNIYQLDSPLTLLFFPLLSFFERIRMGIIVLIFKTSPFWKPLEKYEAYDVLPKLMGKKAFKIIWEPLFINKFGEYAGIINLAWFWARIKKRTTSLAYPKGGFLSFALSIVDKIKLYGGKFYFDCEVVKITENNKIALIVIKNKKEEKFEFDKVIVTVPSTTFLKIAPALPEKYKKNLRKLKSLGATNLVLRLNKPFFKDNTYWLNVCDKNSPIMAIVEHTNYMDKKYYNNEHLLYIGNYLPEKHLYFSKNKEEILEIFDSYLKKINKTYRLSLISYHFIKTPFAQPVFPINYSKLAPGLQTPLINVYLANMEQVFPWDRGTNYAVELGQKIAEIAVK